ncbi:flagellin [Sphingomonas morindae]|uniref:Flagellin n=1 Tax=Sphingomonas morindae TaxID=1541170 RepID=A0ABY4X592_9SPHN|nr:flagellin [Sphingomonas morindae]USI72017.1 flagellin [Sphingomonas morindae]
MIRIATLPMQAAMRDLLVDQGNALQDATMRKASGKRLSSFAELGADTGRNLATRTLLAQYEGQKVVLDRVDTALALYKTRLGEIDTAASSLRTVLLKGIGTGDIQSIMSEAEAAFGRFRESINAADDGTLIFAGGRTDTPPLGPNRLSDMATIDPATLFANDDFRRSARLSDGYEMRYGIVASDFGQPFATAFKILATLGPVGPDGKATREQLDKMGQARVAIDDGLKLLRTADANNGNSQARVDDIVSHLAERSDLLTKALSDMEDADDGALSMEITTRDAMYKSSLAAFRMVNSVSLADYL